MKNLKIPLLGLLILCVTACNGQEVVAEAYETITEPPETIITTPLATVTPSPTTTPQPFVTSTPEITTPETTTTAEITSAETTSAISAPPPPPPQSTGIESILNSAVLSPDYFLESMEDNDLFEFLLSENLFTEGVDIDSFSEISFLNLKCGEYCYVEKYGGSVDPKGCDIAVKQKISEITNNNMSNYDKVKAVYDWIIDNTEFDNGGWGDYRSIHFIFCDKKGLCYDFSYVFMTMMRYLGFEARYIKGTTGPSPINGKYSEHAWVEVHIDGSAYIFDPQIEKALNIYYNRETKYSFFGKTYAEYEKLNILYKISN